MAMTGRSFAAEVAAFAAKTEKGIEAVFRQSCRDVIAEMQQPMAAGGRMRVDTGFLRASLQASTSMPNIDPNARPIHGQSYSFDFGQIGAVIDAAGIGDALYFGYRAAYAGQREYGAGGQPPDGFVRLAAQNWPVIVARNAGGIGS